MGFLHWEKWGWEEFGGVGELGLPQEQVWEKKGLFERIFGVYLARCFLPFSSPIYSWLCVCVKGKFPTSMSSSSCKS